MTPLTRAAGILLHPTCLPGPYGIGDVGPTARAWIDTLARAKQRYWQILPLGPTGYGDSPYQCFSAFAGNPALISPELLVTEGLLTAEEAKPTEFPTDHVEYGPVLKHKQELFRKAFQRYSTGRASVSFHAFCADQASWLNSYSLFMALKDYLGSKAWYEWESGLRHKERRAIEAVMPNLANGIAYHKFCQFLFFRQWRALKEYAHSKGIRIIGDAPIFVSLDSADVWASPELFLLDEELRPTVVAGVPPDYFSPTGQLWGNPHYDWEKMKSTRYAWWVSRLRTTLDCVDLIRLDHFRGFAAAWQVPFGNSTAEVGEWVDGPGADLFHVLRAELNGLPLIAEDLGVITEDVEALRDEFGLPGMRILQFAFGGDSDDKFLPHNHIRNCVVYTGTHDNDTTRGWYETAPPHQQDFVRRYLARPDSEVTPALMRAAMGSVADLAIIPVQDLLGLGSKARINTPGVPAGNWQWRLQAGQMNEGHVNYLREITEIYGRAVKPKKPAATKGET